jgi:ring-1,2-phenylacetyl-CoA epoxidase subunit PaaC
VDYWPYTGELFIPAPYETETLLGFDLSALKYEWLKQISAVFEEANLSLPENIFMHTGGKTGTHTEHLGFLLAEMQYLQRSHPGATW